MRTALFLLGLTGYIYGQGVNPSSGFEVASIRPRDAKSAAASIDTSDGRFTARNVPLRVLIATGYGIRQDNVRGPAWLDARFEVTAKAPNAVPDGDLNGMLLVLLEERFALRAHVQEENTAGFELEVAKSGLKLTPIGPTPKPGRRMQTGQGRLISENGITMEMLALELGRRLGVPVKDATGKHEYFAIKLEYSSDSETISSTSEAPLGPSLFTALKEQAGLQLQSTKLPIPIVVVDSIARSPIDN